MKKVIGLALSGVLVISMVSIFASIGQAEEIPEAPTYGIEVHGRDVTVDKSDLYVLKELNPTAFETIPRLQYLCYSKGESVTLTPEDQLMLLMETEPEEAHEYTIEEYSKQPIEIKYNGDGAFVISRSNPDIFSEIENTKTITKSKQKDMKQTTDGTWGISVTFFATFEVDSLEGNSKHSKYLESKHKSARIPGYQQDTIVMSLSSHTDMAMRPGQSWCQLHIKPEHNFPTSLELVA